MFVHNSTTSTGILMVLSIENELKNDKFENYVVNSIKIVELYTNILDFSYLQQKITYFLTYGV